MDELEIYNNFNIQNNINNSTSSQHGGGSNNILNKDFAKIIAENIEENNNIRKMIELSLCIYKQLNDFNINNTKQIIKELNK